ncbi:MAG: Nramp family divalent metal transporter [Bacteroidetes bacterium]|nr:Nramp family divalent metal transporter [Bacteroidota bacterium]
MFPKAVSFVKNLGPGLLFAGAAVGVSHLVQSTRAGADYGLGLLWAVLLANFFKYPFFQYGPRYALATGESLLEGYRKMGKWVLVVYIVITFATMFTIQTAVTIVTANIAGHLFGLTDNLAVWSGVITLVCILILTVGKYAFLDKIMKVIILTLTICTLLAVAFAFQKTHSIHWAQAFPTETTGIVFLIAFMGWMPAPLDISVWQSLWVLEKKKSNASFDQKSGLRDFNFGLIGAVVLAILFLLLGALVMYGRPIGFSDNASTFTSQLLSLYTETLGSGAAIVVAIAAFTTMFSTTITTLDASPRSMNRAVEIISGKKNSKGYFLWIGILATGTLVIFFFYISEMGTLVKFATITSFLTAPFYALMNFRLVTGKHMPVADRPGKWLRLLSWSGLFFLVSFSIWYLSIL